MCGIFGGTPELIATDVERLLFHRGPDQQGRVVVQGAGGPPVVIGQTRLNVVYKKDVPTPRVIAKGRGETGEAIVALAKEHGIPIEENAPLAQALAQVEIGDDIP